MNDEENGKQSVLLYRNKRYFEGDYITLPFHSGQNDGLIAREDTGRIIILEDGYDLPIEPRDVVDCIVVTVKDFGVDWTGKRRGFSIVRPIRINKKAPAPHTMQEEGSTVPVPEELLKSDSTEEHMDIDSSDDAEYEEEELAEETPTDFAKRLGEHVLKPQVTVDTHSIQGYPRLIRINAKVFVYSGYSQVRWHPTILTAPQNKILKALVGKEVLVAILHPSDEELIVTPYRVKVRAGYVAIPRALRESVRAFHKVTVILQLHKVP